MTKTGCSPENERLESNNHHLWVPAIKFFQGCIPVPETNTKRPWKNGWEGKTFLLGFGNFSGGNCSTHKSHKSHKSIYSKSHKSQGKSYKSLRNPPKEFQKNPIVNPRPLDSPFLSPQGLRVLLLPPWRKWQVLLDP